METPARYNDKDLFLLISEGDEAAFKELFHRYVPLFQPVVNDIVQSELVAKDVIQEVFIRIWLNRNKLPDIHMPRSWLFRILYYQTYSWIRSNTVRDNVKKGLSVLLKDEQVVNQGTQMLTVMDTRRLIKEAIQQLTPQSRRIYLLSREHNLKVSEIAEQLGLSVQTVKNTLGRSLANIREYLEQRGVLLPIIAAWYLSL